MLNANECAEENMSNLIKWVGDAVWNHLGKLNDQGNKNSIKIGAWDKTLDVKLNVISGKHRPSVWFNPHTGGLDEAGKAADISANFIYNICHIHEESRHSCFEAVLDGLKTYPDNGTGWLGAETQEKMRTSLKEAFLDSFNASIQSFFSTTYQLNNIIAASGQNATRIQSIVSSPEQPFSWLNNITEMITQNSVTFIANTTYNALNRTITLLPTSYTITAQTSENIQHGADDDEGWSPMTIAVTSVATCIGAAALGAMFYRHIYKKWCSNDSSQSDDTLVIFTNDCSPPKAQNCDQSKLTNVPSSNLDVDKVQKSYKNKEWMVQLI